MPFSGKLENWLLKRLLNAITLREIMSNDPITKAILVDGNPLTANEVRQMQAEIKAMEGFRIWAIMSETTKHIAEDKIFNKSLTMEDVRYGKSMLYNLSLQKSIMEAVKRKKL